MAKSPPSSPKATSLLIDEDFSEEGNMDMLIASDKVLQGLNDTRSELLNRVESLKQDLQHWRGKLDTEVNSYNEEIGDLKDSLNSDVEQLKNDTSVVDCAQFLEGLNVNCDIEKTLFDDLIADLGLQDKMDSADESEAQFDYFSSDAPVTSVTIEEILE
ncbi:hypothetical protein KC19_5G140900 [Ceratodon purpureus]|uniref:Uncharacterized protein n=1 Tax=Ceratodon purpureus TaxID=3225 RepID=A0A8T0I3W2_CERPU|nr:hypothetical protein KC19_5G140900 [Ceratodon purpureus]KAG0577228.1 hypothetical protein KC19_5G140900 [Ceratodon purpureus]